MAQSTRMIGIDIGGTKCAVSYLNADGEVCEAARFKTTSADETLENISSAVVPLIKGIRPVIGISAGTLGAARGVITGAPNLPGWNDVPVIDFFQTRFAPTTYLMNDAKACALAEWLHGAGRGYRHLAFLTAGTGMGSGLILDGRLYLGAGNAGEVGHVRLAPGLWQTRILRGIL